MEWRFWFTFACLLWLGSLCKVGVFLGAFALGALASLLGVWWGLGPEQQLSCFLLVSLISMVIYRGWRMFFFDKPFRDRL